MKHEGEVFKTKNYGDLVITKYVSFLEVHVRFINTGFTTTTQLGSIKSGKVKDKMLPTVHGVGILGDEQTKVDGKHTKEYRLWHNMLARCYSVGYQKVQPTYIDCSVSENFRYLQYFKEWCNNQIGFNSVDEKGRLFTLDKDILVKGNRVYNEDVCVFVPQEVNLLFIKRGNKRGDCVVGVCKYKGKFVATVSTGKRVKDHLGVFKTEIEAFLAYKQAKEAYIKEVANKWKDKIDLRVYNALMKHEVEITD